LFWISLAQILSRASAFSAYVIVRIFTMRAPICLSIIALAFALLFGFSEDLRAQSLNQAMISTVAGAGGSGSDLIPCPPNSVLGDNGPAVSAGLSCPWGVALDNGGNFYIADQGNCRIRRVDGLTGVITTVAGGTGGAPPPTITVCNYNGDNIPATSAILNYPTDVAVDAAGDIFIVDSLRIRRVDATTGLITTVAGTGVSGYNGDNIPASSAMINVGSGRIAVDGAGNLYIADYGNNRIRRVDATTGIITTIAGNGFTDNNGFGGFSGDGGLATSAEVNNPEGIAIDSAGNLYIADTRNERIRMVTAATGIISTIAGNGTLGYGGDGIAATATELGNPDGIAVDSLGNVYIAEGSRVRRVDATGIITTVAGVGFAGYNGDNIPATRAQVTAVDVAVDSSGSLYLADNANFRIRKVTPPAIVVNPSGPINFGQINVGQSSAVQSLTYRFNATIQIGSISVLTQGASGKDFQSNATTTCTAATYNSGSSCTLNLVFSPTLPGVRSGTVILYDTSSPPNAIGLTQLSGVGLGPIIALEPGIIKALAGTANVSGYSGDGGPALNAQLNTPLGVATDGTGNIYIADFDNNRIRKIDSTTGAITTFAGGGSGCAGQSDTLGDGCAATEGVLNTPSDVAVDYAGNVYIADYSNNLIRRVDAATNVITTFAGGSPKCTTPTDTVGDGCPATGAVLATPFSIALDGSGNLYIADTGNNRLRKVDATTGFITSIAGNGVAGSTGDGGAATAAELNEPGGVAVDSLGNIYVGEYYGFRISRIDSATGLITTVAGNGTLGNSGDNGPATQAQLSGPWGIGVDSAGDLYISDYPSNVVRKVNAATGVITTIASGGRGTYGLSLDGAGNLYLADGNDDLINTISTGPLNFPQTNVGSSSAPQTITASNIGNSSLIFSDFIVSQNFGIDSGTTTCSTSSPLAIGTSCTVGIVFAPTAGGNLAGTLTITDNALNVSGATQQVQLSGVGNAVVGATTTSIDAPTITYGSPAGVTVSVSSGQGTVTGSVSLTVDNGSPLIQPLSSGSTTFSVSGLGAGSHNLSASYAAQGNFGASSASGMLQVNQAIPTISISNIPNNAQYVYGGSFTPTYAYNGDGTPSVTSSTPATCTATGGVVSFVGVGTCTLTSQATAGTNYAAITGSPQSFAIAPVVISGPAVTTSPNPVSFPTTQVGSAAATQNVLLSINASLTISSISVPLSQGGVQEFIVGIVSGCIVDGTTTIPTLSICTVPITFQPSYPGMRGLPLVVQSSLGTFNFALEGTGVGPALAFTPGIITTTAGNGIVGYGGDGGPGTAAELTNPQGLVVDNLGNLYVADQTNHRIRKVDTAGTITTVAGNGTAGYAGDGGPATSAELNNPSGVAVDGSDNLYIVDESSHRIRKVDTAGTITTVAGNGTAGYAGDGGPATSAELYYPVSVAVDNAGNLYIAEYFNSRIRKVDATGTISTVAGNGSLGYAGDGGPATAATLFYPTGVALDNAGNLYIADQNNQRIRKVDANGIITTVAGNGTAGYVGDGGPATSAAIDRPTGVSLDNAGGLYIAEYGGNRIRKVDVNGTITTVAGNGIPGFTGDGGLATNGQLNVPEDLALDSGGNLFIGDSNNARIRKVDVTTSALTFASVNVGQNSVAQTVMITNIGNAALNISALATSNNFNVDQGSTTCSTASPLAVGASCAVGVVFAPATGGGALAGTLTITDNALNVGGATQQVQLSGVGVVASPTTTNISAPSITYGGAASVTVSVSSGQGTVTGNVSLTVDNGAPLMQPLVSGSTLFSVSGLGSGSHSLSASYSAQDNFAASSGTGTLQVNQATPTISISNIPNSATYGGSFTPTYTYTGDGTTSVSSTTPGTCTVSGALVNFVGAGTCTLTAQANAGTNYAAVIGSQQSFTIAQATPSISINDVPVNAVYGGSFTPTYTYAGNGTTSVSSSTIATCTVSGSLVNFVRAGTCTLIAHAAATMNYAAATGSPQSFTIAQANTTISINNIPANAVYTGSFVPIYAYIGDGSPSVTSSTTTTCTVSGGVVSFVGAGTCTLTAHATMGTNYTTTNGNPQSFTIAQLKPTISIMNIPINAQYGGNFTPTYMYNGDGTTSVTSSTAATCTVSGALVNFVGVGTCTLTAHATATVNSTAATGSPQSFSIAKATPKISINNIPLNAVYQGSFTPSYTYAGNGSTSTTSSTTNTCTVSSKGIVSFVRAGTCTLMAHATATTNYAAATSTAQSFTIAQATTTISIKNIPTNAKKGGTFTPTYNYIGDGTRSTISDTPATCTVSGSIVSFVASGTCTLTAQATAGTNYAATNGTPQSFTIK
jgi:sugar lactone lactonase YvrE